MREKQKEQNMATSDQITELPLTHKQITSGVLEFMKDKAVTPPTVREPVIYK